MAVEAEFLMAAEAPPTVVVGLTAGDTKNTSSLLHSETQGGGAKWLCRFCLGRSKTLRGADTHAFPVRIVLKMRVNPWDCKVRGRGVAI